MKSRVIKHRVCAERFQYNSRLHNLFVYHAIGVLNYQCISRLYIKIIVFILLFNNAVNIEKIAVLTDNFVLFC
jgi:hypothetical protein